MLSAKSLFQEIVDNDESFRLFCSIAASGESQGGWENARIAALVPPSERALAPKITRHGADEDKHGRIFNALMKKRGLEPVEVPPETDYTMLLERRRHRPRARQAQGATSRSPCRTSSPTSPTAGSPNSAPPTRWCCCASTSPTTPRSARPSG